MQHGVTGVGTVIDPGKHQLRRRAKGAAHGHEGDQSGRGRNTDGADPREILQ
jgi:hypothetical protein